MAKKIWFVSVLFLSCVSLQAQFTLQPVVPSVGMIQKSQLWNVLVINASTNATTARLNVVLRNRLTGEELFTANTGEVLLTSGSKQLNVNILNPIQYNYLSQNIRTLQNELLPIGSYTACYTLIGKFQTIAEECVSFDVEPLSPPMLIFPNDSAILETAPTQFNWLPPSPYTQFSQLNYELFITEINEGQTAVQAIQENLPFYTQAYLKTNNYSYTNASIKFETGKWYAWQVVATDANTYAAKTETWIFQVSKKVTQEDPNNKTYCLMNNINNGHYNINKYSIDIKFQSYFSTYSADIKIVNSNNRVIKELKQEIQQGDNFMEIRLPKSLRIGEQYKMILTDVEQKEHVLTFSINKK
jgi:hypothetical protein